jgi:hypothetical protein
MKHCTLLALPLCLLLALSGCDMPGADDAGEMPDNAMFHLEGMWHYSEVTEPCYDLDGAVVAFERGPVKLKQYQGVPHDSDPNLELMGLPPHGRVLRGHLRGDRFSLAGRIDYVGTVCHMYYAGEVTNDNYLWGEEIISSCDHPTSGEPIFLRCAATVMLRAQ